MTDRRIDAAFELSQRLAELDAATGTRDGLLLLSRLFAPKGVDAEAMALDLAKMLDDTASLPLAESLAAVSTVLEQHGCPRSILDDVIADVLRQIEGRP